MMKKFLAAAALSASAFVAMAPAQAVTYVITGSPFTVPPSASALFGRTVTANGNFVDLATFTLNAVNGAETTAGLQSTRLGSTRVQFNSVKLYRGLAANDGTALVTKIADFDLNTAVIGTTTHYLASLDETTLGTGDYYFRIDGRAFAQPATYSGNVNFMGVPEPATWALMVLGFGLVGASMRSRRRSAVAA